MVPREELLFSREIAAGVEIDLLEVLRPLLAGAGNTGSHLVERAIRNFIYHMYIVDNDRKGYEPHNFPHSSILLKPEEDAGKPKAETLAARANEKLLSGGRYYGRTMDIRDLGPEVIKFFDIVLAFFDNRQARKYLYEIAREANVPFLEIGLSDNGDWQLQLYDHASGAPCYCCNLGKEQLAQSCAYTYYDDVSHGIAPTTDVAGAEAAAFAMEAMMKFFSRDGFPCNTKFRYDSKKMILERLTGVKNPNCEVCSLPTQSASDIHHLKGRVDQLTYQELETVVAKQFSCKVSICLPDRFVVKDYCPKCGKEKLLMMPERRIVMSDVICPECRGIKEDTFLSRHVNARENAFDGVDALPPEIKMRTLFELGFPFGGYIYGIDEENRIHCFTLDDDIKILDEFK